MIHPFVRDLYKRVVIVSKDYPTTDHQHIKHLWKTAIRNPDNCPSWYNTKTNVDTTIGTNANNAVSSNVTSTSTESVNDLNELHHAVHRGRQMVKEMIGIVQLHKYRTMKQRYNNNDTTNSTATNELYNKYNNHNKMNTTTSTATANQEENSH